jgi:hypothetical protein
VKQNCWREFAEFLGATIRRDELFDDGVELLKKFGAEPMDIELVFNGEVGFGSGLTHEFIVLCLTEIARREH